jgi:hypothetical protein
VTTDTVGFATKGAAFVMLGSTNTPTTRIGGANALTLRLAGMSKTSLTNQLRGLRGVNVGVANLLAGYFVCHLMPRFVAFKMFTLSQFFQFAQCYSYPIPLAIFVV